MKQLYEKPLRELEKLLKEAGVSYEFLEMETLSGGQIIVDTDADQIDAVCNDGSYGAEMGLLEIMGGLTEKENRKDFVLGYLTPEEVAKRFIYCYKNKTTVFGQE